MIFPERTENWFMTARFDPSGYIKDDDAKEWNADDLLKSIQEGTEAGNEERKQRGIPEMEIVGWVGAAGLRRGDASPGLVAVVARQGRARRRTSRASTTTPTCSAARATSA